MNNYNFLLNSKRQVLPSISMANLSTVSLKEKTTPQNTFVVYLGYLAPQALLETMAHLDHMAGLGSQAEMAEKAKREKRMYYYS
ncbi:hypothetical protein E2320_008067 [Naja naja]|nr:hypothetical protein E2320_008067 [Naja naja]